MPEMKVELTLTPAWQCLSDTLGKAFSGFLQTELEVVAMPPALPDPAYVAFITLSSIEAQVELGVGIICDAASVSHMAEALFGDASLAEDEEMVRDLLAETSNIAMGGLKTSFVESGISFTGGIPKRCEMHELHAFLGSFGTKKAAAFKGGAINMISMVGLKKKKQIKVPAKMLREGMILAEDFLSDSGAMLTPAGTRLTSTSSERLVNIDPDRLVAIIDPSS